VRINLPIPEDTARAIESVAQPVIAPMTMLPLTEAVVTPNIPDSVVEDLTPPSLEAVSAPSEAVVAALPEFAVSGLLDAVAAEPGPRRPEPIDPVIDPVSVIPEPVIASLIEPPVLQSEPVPTAPVVVEQPSFEPAAASEVVVPAPEMSFDLPPQPSPEPMREELAVTAAPAEPRRIFVAPVPEALAPVVPVLPVLPPQPLPEPAREETLLAVALPAAEPSLLPARPPRVAEAIVAAAPPAPLVLPSLLPEPAPVVQPVLAMLSEPELAAPAIPLFAPIVNIPEPVPALPAAAPGDAVASGPETARLKDVLASLSVPASPIAPAPEPPKPAAPPAPTVPAARSPAPSVASQASSHADASRSIEPASLTSEWRASVPASTDVRISNGTGRGLMASRFAGYFRGHGVIVSKVANANSFDYRRTVLFYNPDQRAQAEALAAALPFPVRLAEAKQGHGQIELVLGFDLVSVDDALRSA
jgi:hypothetical protein